MSLSQGIFDIIRNEGAISRIELHRRFKLRAATVTRISDKLLEQNLICACGKNSAELGRSPELLRINDAAFHVLGLHAVSGEIRGGIVSSGGKILKYQALPMKGKLTAKSFLSCLGKSIEKILETAKEGKIEIAGIGLAMPGELDFKTGVLTQAAVILPGLTNVPCKAYVEKLTGLPVIVDHDSAMITQAEAFWGRAKDCRNMGTFFAGHGIGGKFIIDGKLFRGARNRSGELGHIPLRRDGPLCRCGLRGCIEALASIPVIEKNYGGGTSFKNIVMHAEDGEAKALNVLKEAANYIGEAMAMIFDILDIEMLVVNGDIIRAEKIIKQDIIESVCANAHSKHPANREFLTFSSFGTEVGVLGAAAFSVKSVMKSYGIEV